MPLPSSGRTENQPNELNLVGLGSHSSGSLRSFGEASSVLTFNNDHANYNNHNLEATSVKTAAKSSN